MYPPLELSKMLNIADVPDGNPLKPYLERMAGGDSALFADFYFNDTFLTAKYDGPHPEFESLVRERWQVLYRWAVGSAPEHQALTKPNRATVKDSLANMATATKWWRYKKVYEFDEELELTLASVDKVDVPVRMLDKLPYKTFYIQFAPGGVFADRFHGAFVNAVQHGNGYLLHIIRLREDLATMSGRGVFSVSGSGQDPHFVVDRKDVDGHHGKDLLGTRADWEEFCFFALNAMLYLCASNAEVRPAKGSAYKPSSKPSGRWSDIEKFECGYAYGEAIRLSRKEKEKEKEGDGAEDAAAGAADAADAEGNGENGGHGKGKPKRPHPVKASWQHYWVGKGDEKERVLRFKAAYWAGGKADIAHIQRVKG